MLRLYNPGLVGASSAANSVIFPGSLANQGLNLAVSGAWAGGPNSAAVQADTVVAEVQKIAGWADQGPNINIELLGCKIYICKQAIIIIIQCSDINCYLSRNGCFCTVVR